VSDVEDVPPIPRATGHRHFQHYLRRGTQVTTNHKTRRAAAIALVAVGAAGLTMAAASQLTMSWTGNFQAGSVVVSADCQPTASTISAAFSTPTFAAAQTLPWNVASVSFSGIHASCNTKTYQAAYKLATGDWVAFGATGTVAGTSVTVAIPSGVDAQAIKSVALTIYGS
jgi:hypothetical protein